VTEQLRLGKLRDDLDAIDRTLRVFGPSQHPEKIRPVVKRKGDRMFAAVLDMIGRLVLTVRMATPLPRTISEQSGKRSQKSS
jgi:hypothetical protein